MTANAFLMFFRPRLRCHAYICIRNHGVLEGGEGGQAKGGKKHLSSPILGRRGEDSGNSVIREFKCSDSSLRTLMRGHSTDLAAPLQPPTQIMFLPLL